MDNGLMERYVVLAERKRRLEAETDAVKREIAALEDAVLEGMIDAGLQSVKTAAGSTVYLHRQLWANPVDGDYERACRYLRMAGLGALVAPPRFDSHALMAWCREREAAGKLFSDAFTRAFRVSPKVSVRVRGL